MKRILIIYCILWTLIVLYVLLCSGCSSRTFFYTGQALDGYTTHHVVSNGGTEVNPLYGEEPSLERICLIKGIYIGITELMVALDPDNADTYYKVGGILGWSFGVWNLSQM